jgi:hypothetical protein
LIFVKQFLDSQRDFYISLPINSLAGAVFLGRKHGKFRLPITQHMRLHSSKFTYLTYFEEEFFRYRYGRTSHDSKLSMKCSSWRNLQDRKLKETNGKFARTR